MQLTSFNLTAIKRLETYLGIQPSNQLTPDTLSEKIQKKLNFQNNYNPFNNYDLQSESIKQEIRSLITEAEKKYNSDWRKKREINRIENEGRVGVGTGSPLPSLMEQFKNSSDIIPAHALPEALDMVAKTLNRRSTANFNASYENALDMGIRKFPRAITSLISNALNYLVKYPILAGVGGGIAAGAIVTEGASRFSLLLVSALAYGALNIAERLESTNLSRRVLNKSFEFEIQGVKDSILNVIDKASNKYYTYDFFKNYLFGDAKQEKTPQQKTKTPALGKSKSLGGEDISIYYKAHASGDKSRLQAAEDARFEANKKFQVTKEAERKEREETKQKAKKPQQPQHTSSFPSQSPGQIRNSLFGSDIRSKRASTMQSSSLSKSNPQQPRRNGGVDNIRPGSAPRQPLRARRESSKGTHVGPDSRYAR